MPSPSRRPALPLGVLDTSQHNGQSVQTAYMAIDRRTERGGAVHTPNGMHFSGDRDIRQLAAEWLRLEDRVLGDTEQSQDTLHDPTCGGTCTFSLCEVQNVDTHWSPLQVPAQGP